MLSNPLFDDVLPSVDQYIYDAGGYLDEIVSQGLKTYNLTQKITGAGDVLGSAFGSNTSASQRQFIKLNYQPSINYSNAVLIYNTYYDPHKSYSNVDLKPYGMTTAFSSPIVENYFKTISNTTLGDQLIVGNAGNIYLKNTPVGVKGWQDSITGDASSVVNKNKNIYASSYDASLYGRPGVYNLTQYRYLSGYDASRYGNAYLMGGVKYLTLYGISSNTFGSAVVTNTTANQTAVPQGINSAIVPAPSVSPRILYATGIASPLLGRPDVRDPAIKPIGETHTTYGTPTVWFHTRPLAPAGILAYESGYLRIADPTQFALVPSLIESAIFGDTAIKNTSTRITVSGIDELSFSDYATLTNSNRSYAPNGISSLSIGAAAVKNKTPSIFVDGITHYDIGLPAIGHAIRSVQPTGFDHLLFGRAVLTKTPEVFPRGHQSSVVGATTIWHKNRTLELSQKGINSFKPGEQTVWYGQRPIKTKGWQTSSYGQPVLTHEVREVIAQGFRRDAYGMAWVSFGTRRLEPVSIYKDFPSNHMVGGTQKIEPVGYIATLWGTRIIPESQSVAPIGFTGVFGDTLVDLFTKYIAPVGYISVGQQPADRWGDIVVYNKLQYIVQEFDVNSGLVPPKWSDYLLIANRNIQMNVTGFASQRFGYQQIDNNATPLLPNGIEPPLITIGMISHGIRAIAPEAIEAPPISTWGVVHNGARVLAPLGHTHTQWGDNGTVVNTRREYRNVGRIDSLETGVPMIAYRIRTIDIEPRYSIEPPQINLPAIDLHTRYVTFRGYETAKYGKASLSIHFNIIGPSWAHRDKFGESVVRNVTPELLVGAFDSQEFGRASIRTQWRHVQAQGDTATLFGSAMIADTKREIVIRGWQDSITSQQPTVIKTGTPPYVTQNIWLQNESDPSRDGYGIFDGVVSEVLLNQNVLYHKGHNSNKFGEAFVRSNVLNVSIGMATENLSINHFVTNKVRGIDLKNKGIDNRISVSDGVSVTPHYIRVLNIEGVSSRFGQTVFTLRNRTVKANSFTSSRTGTPTLDLNTRHLYPSPIRSYSIGIPSIPFTPQDIKITNAPMTALWGMPLLSRPPYVGPQEIKVNSINSMSIGVQNIDLLNRQLQTIGSNSLSMGQKKDFDKPYMWQGLRIGEFVPMSIGAGDTSLFGDTRIGLRVREIPIEGFVAFRSEYEPSKFKDRMRVTRSNSSAEDNLIQSINAIGIKSEVTGAVEVKWGQQFIRPDGNSEQFRKGAF